MFAISIFANLLPSFVFFPCAPTGRLRAGVIDGEEGGGAGGADGLVEDDVRDTKLLERLSQRSDHSHIDVENSFCVPVHSKEDIYIYIQNIISFQLFFDHTFDYLLCLTTPVDGLNVLHAVKDKQEASGWRCGCCWLPWHCVLLLYTWLVTMAPIYITGEWWRN